MSDKGWNLQIVLGLILGIPAYIAFGFPIGLAVHAVLALCYVGMIAMFGKGSSIEMWLPVAILSVLLAVLKPVLERAEQNKVRAERTESAR